MASNGAGSRGDVLLGAAAVVVVIAGMRAAEPILVPFLLSVFIAVICTPPLFWLERRGVPSAAAMLVVVAAILAVGFAVTALLGNSINDFSRNVPLYNARLKEQFGGVVPWLAGHGVHVSREQLLGFVNPGKAMVLVGNLFNGFGGILANAFLIALTVVFMLFEAHSFPVKLRAVVDDPERSLARFREFAGNVRRYLGIKTMTSLGTAIGVGIWLAVLGVNYPVLWALLAFLLNYVPNIGSIIAAVPPILLALVQLGPGAAAWTAVGYAVVGIVFGNVVEPRYMGQGLGLSTLVVFLSLVFWGWVLGPVGMFLSVPLTMTAKIALDASERTRWIAVLLGPERAATLVAGDTGPPDADGDAGEEAAG